MFQKYFSLMAEKLRFLNIFIYMLETLLLAPKLQLISLNNIHLE